MELSCGQSRLETADAGDGMPSSSIAGRMIRPVFEGAWDDAVGQGLTGPLKA